ncbi:MAG: hypothetical protein WD063_19625 [Pirellulales bacterium]
MAKPPHYRSDHPHATVNTAAGGAAAAIFIWAWLAIYLVAFFRDPLAGGAAEMSRLDYLFAALLRPDDMVRQWLAGAGWESLAKRGVILGVTAAILSVAMAAGWTCLRLLRVDRALSRLEMSLFSLGAGLNLVSLATLVLGLGGWLRLEAFLALGLVALATAGLVYWRAGCASGTAPSGEKPNGGAAAGDWPLGRRWLWLAAPFVAAIVLSAMLPPVDFDVREYHLQAPKEFYQAGRITFLAHNVYANMPLGAELLGLPAMVALDDWFSGALVGKTLIALFAPLGALALYAACLRFASPAAGIVAALVYISIPWVALVSTVGLVEGVFAFYLFAAFYGALIWKCHLKDNTAGQATSGTGTRQCVDRTTWGLLAMSGFLSGAAVSTKYPAVVYSVLPLAMYVLYQAVSSHALRDARTGLAAWIATPLAVFLLATAFGCAPWFVKNAALTGNPTYPLLYGLFDGATRTAEKNEQWQRAHQPPNFDPQDLARRAWDATLASDWISPLVVPLAVLAFLPRLRGRLAWLVGGYLVFVFAAWWLLTHRIDRFLVPAMPLAALLAGLGATWTAATWWRRSLAAFLAIGLAFDFLVMAGGPVADNRYLANLSALRVDPARVDPWHLYFNRRADDVRGLLLVGDAQPFDLEVPTTYNTVFDDSIFEQLARGRTPQEVRAALDERGISHVYVAWSEIDRYRSRGNYGITGFLEPRVFDELVAAGVLERLPPLADSSASAFRLLPGAKH